MKKSRARATKPRNWQVTHHGRNVHVVKVNPSTSRGWEQWLYLRSDAHTDNAKADHALEVRHLKEAVERDAIIIDCGDALDLMCGVADRRQSKAMLRSSHLAAAYFDRVIEESAERYAPYSSHWAVLGTGNHECLDDSSEVLTKRGWVRITDVTLADEVASMHPHDGNTVWANPLKVHSYDYDGEMVEVNQRGMSMRVTPNHRIAYYVSQNQYGQARNGRLSYVMAEQAEKMSCVHVPAYANSTQAGCKWSDDQIRLAAWVLTDGHVSSANSKPDIYQSKPHGIEKIRSILSLLNLKFTEKVRPGRFDGIIIKSALPQHIFSIEREAWMNDLFGVSPKSMPAWLHDCTDRQFDIFLESYIDGDGSRRKEEGQFARVVYGTAEMLSALQAACITHGYRASLSWQERDGGGYYRLNVTRRPVMTCLRRNFTRTRHVGKVHCLTTVTGNFFIRRNGIAYLTGNSAWLKHHECDPTAHLVRAIKMHNRESPIAAGGWGGWVKVQVTLCNSHLTWTLRYAHGGSAGGAMTFGTLDTRRMYSWIEGADMIAMGHTHDSNIVGISREYLESNGGVYEVRKRHCDFVRIGNFKDDWGDGSAGWAVEKNGGPKPTRAKWVRLFARHETVGEGKDARGRVRLAWEVFDAQ